ncbi:MAG: VWA domain-containing protein [Pseudomonadota bacterium]|nr:VWA domain-containing protein [Pseudomonadota bacterium]MEC9144764.1 VWA domain-containing protein [Pseudomonadota bacterium]
MTGAGSNVVSFPLPRARRSVRGRKLAANITLFVRTLRRAGVSVGPATAVDCVEAARLIDIGDRDQFYHALSSCIVKRPEDRLLFDQAFHIFWRNPRLMEKMRDLLLPTLSREPEDGDEQPQTTRRVDEALRPDRPQAPLQAEDNETIEIDMSMTSSPDEQLRNMDFQMMSTAEISEAEAAIDRMRLPVPLRPSRRFVPENRGGRVSFRRTIRQMTRRGGLAIPLHEAPRQRPRPLVVICDISGSMERYSRMLLRFTHALTQRRGTVHSFLFGTRLTNVSRQMRDRDPDAALRSVAANVEDWSGGTRISGALADFNRDWSRRVLGQGAVVLLITDGLERDPDSNLGFEIERLHKSCSRLIWLNPLLRFDRFEPRSLGVQQILPHVDAFVPIHSLDSMADLAAVLSADLPSNWRHRDLEDWQHSLRSVQSEALAGESAQ